MSDGSMDLRAQLLALLAAGAPRAVCVAFSGGRDSTVLLHALAGLRTDLASGGVAALSVRAVHVDHQMQAPSGQWAVHCEAVFPELITFNGPCTLA